MQFDGSMGGMVTLIDPDGQTHELIAEGLFVDAAGLERASGWALEPEGLCRGEVCVPLFGRTITDPTGRVDLVAWAEALDLPLAYDDDGVAAYADPPGERAVLAGPAPELTLPDLDGNLRSFSEGRGRKRVLATWASWCGCRDELPGWQALHEELAPLGLFLYSVALDEPVTARPWIEKAAPTFPVVVDAHHVTADRYAITNVPSVVWVDEEDQVVKPPTIAPGDDTYVDYTRVPAARHHDALRRWVERGELPEVADVPARTRDQQLALAHRRVAAHLRRLGRDFLPHLERARELAPHDWTVVRSGIALKGEDPFLGDEFIAFWTEWDEAGRPGYRPTT